MTTPERVLRAGINFTNGAELKFAHAVRHFHSLLTRIGEWNAAGGVIAYPSPVDENTVEFRAIVDSPPPIDEWSLIFGDAIHNFRGVFDALIWAFAHLDDGFPAHPERVTMPITESESKWKKFAAENLDSVPADVLERLRSVQPWAQGVPLTQHFLWIVHRLDILDKHKRLIEARLYSGNIRLHALDMRLEPPEPLGAPYNITMAKNGTEIANDAVIFTLTCPTNTINIDPSYRARIETEFRFVGEDARGAFLVEFMNMLITQVRETVDVLVGGEAVAKANIAARLQTGSTLITTQPDENGDLSVLVNEFSEKRQ